MKAFLSRPLWVQSHVANHLRDLDLQLEMLGFEVKTVGANVTSFASPFEEAVRVLSACDCAIILGLPYLRVQSGTLRDQEIQTGFALPSEWNHIEAAIAILLKKPTLMMLHRGVARRGLFDRGAANLFIHEFHTFGPKWVKDIVPKLEDLKEKVEAQNGDGE